MGLGLALQGDLAVRCVRGTGEEPQPAVGDLRVHRVPALRAGERRGRLDLPHRLPCLPAPEIGQVREDGSPLGVHGTERHQPPSERTITQRVLRRALTVGTSEPLGADGQQAGACLGTIQDGGHFGPDAGGRVVGQQGVHVQGGRVVAVRGAAPSFPVEDVRAAGDVAVVEVAVGGGPGDVLLVVDGETIGSGAKAPRPVPR